MSDDAAKPEDTPPPPPPIKLPTPDGFGDINRATKISKEKAKGEKKKKKERRHPKDPYAPVKNRRGGCGCLLALLFLVVLPVGGAFLWVNHLKTELTSQGYSWVTVSGKNLTEAPTEKTAYFGGQVLYEASETRAEVAFVGGTWWLGGTFHEKVTFRGAQLNLEPGAVFLKGLDVQAAKFDMGSARVEGEITGKILQQTAAP